MIHLMNHSQLNHTSKNMLDRYFNLKLTEDSEEVYN